MRRRSRPVAVALLTVGVVATGCGGPTADGVTTLVKAHGWSPSLDTEDERFGGYFAVLEIAYDEPTAAAAWEAVVPADLPAADGEPHQAGRYGGLEDVDFDEQVLAVYSSGQSGSCPGWLADVVVDDGTIELTRREHVPGNGCSDDYNPYRLVLAVDRDKLPPVGTPPTDDVLVDGRRLSALVTSYPAG